MASLNGVLGAAGTNPEGSIHLVTGPMFSGKTSEILRRVEVARAAGHTCLLVRPLHDTRWTKEVLQTHSHRTLTEKDVKVRWTNSLVELAKEVREENFGVVAVDEGQFLDDLAEGCIEFASQKRHVLVSALDGAFDQTPFASVSKLYPHCEEVVKLQAVCMCCRARPASFTTLRSGLKQLTRRDVVGGVETYLAVCRPCLQDM